MEEGGESVGQSVHFCDTRNTFLDWWIEYVVSNEKVNPGVEKH